MRLLLIMPNFFGYPKIIVDELSSMGYEVDCFDDRPSTNAFVKAAIRINKKTVQILINNYFNKIMKTIKTKKYDYVFLISGQSLSFNEDMMNKIKSCQPNAKFILYQWDSQKNFPYIINFHKYFDVIFSFDRKDVDETRGLHFLPLFYSNVYKEIGDKVTKGNYKYDFCFVGTAHPKKYMFINEISKQLKQVFPNQFIYFYFQSIIVYWYRKINNVEFKFASYKDFHYTPLKESEICKIYEESKCILDSAQSGQTGITIRAIEALGAKRKLITTNADIVNYDFYRPENIYVYKGCIDLNDPFFKKDYFELDTKLYEKYSLRTWLKTILLYRN